MAQPEIPTSDMSPANFGIPTPPANEISDGKNPFFSSPDVSTDKEGKNSILSTSPSTHDAADASSEPTTPEIFVYSQSKSRYYIKDQALVPFLIAKIAEENNIKLPDSSPFQCGGNYGGNLPISAPPSVCESVSSLPDLSDSASTPISHEEDSSDSVTSDRPNVMSSSVTSSGAASGSITSPIITSPSSITKTSYSARVLQRLTNSSTNAASGLVDNKDHKVTSDHVKINEKEEDNNNTTISSSRTSIVNAIVAAAAAPRMKQIPNRSIRRSKRKGIPYKSPCHEDLLREPGFVFSFPVLFGNAIPNQFESEGNDKNETTERETNTGTGSPTVVDNEPSSESSQNLKSKGTTIMDPMQHVTIDHKNLAAKIIHRPVLLPDIVRSLTQARRSKMRRPVTRAKNRRENQELELLGLEHMMDSPNGNATAGEEGRVNRKRRVPTVGRPSKKPNLLSSGSQAPRSSNSGENKSPRGSSCSTSPAFYRIPSKRRDSMSVSSLSSIPSSELSDFDLNSDNFGDDEDDPDFAPPAKKRKPELQKGPKAPGRKESSSKVKVCASCRTKSTPCWRPGWSTDLMLCNSCGLRYKKTKCVCTNPECRYIPLKTEYNAMLKKPKNADVPDLKRCCKCQTPL
ncbi:7650_t:CDS:2 [Funneliformis mosseae]|uniref:7650_t:CDS:1 n=1 Tax=Funneliformis mosseae TaxID=27381 RepID=A0A9N8WLU9_FUNMO|nr:7650_t:CDS:2 [Funneliformis mosseae]